MNEQDIFDKAYILLESLGYNIYTYKPMDKVPYPFIEMTNAETDRTVTKSDNVKLVRLSIDVWGYASKRREVATMKSVVLNALVDYFNVKESEIEDRLIQDTSTTDVLLHGMLVVPIYIN